MQQSIKTSATDPKTGRPVIILNANEQPLPRFDAVTGQPIDPDATIVVQQGFDSMTGQPIYVTYPAAAVICPDSGMHLINALNIPPTAFANTYIPQQTVLYQNIQPANQRGGIKSKTAFAFALTSLICGGLYALLIMCSEMLATADLSEISLLFPSFNIVGFVLGILSLTSKNKTRGTKIMAIIGVIINSLLLIISVIVVIMCMFAIIWLLFGWTSIFT